MRRSHSFSLLLLALFISRAVVLPLQAQKPLEVLVQTGHMAPVHMLTLSGDQRLLVSLGTDGVLKVWDVASTREIRTVRSEGGINNIYWVDHDRFAVVLRDRVDIFNRAGNRVGQTAIPTIQGYGSKAINRSGKYLLERVDMPRDVRFFDMKDGSELKLPEQRIDSFRSNIVDLGNGLFGVFYDEYKYAAEERNIGNTGYVLFDDDLQGQLPLRLPAI